MPPSHAEPRSNYLAVLTKTKSGQSSGYETSFSPPSERRVKCKNTCPHAVPVRDEKHLCWRITSGVYPLISVIPFPSLRLLANAAFLFIFFFLNQECQNISVHFGSLTKKASRVKSSNRRTVVEDQENNLNTVYKYYNTEHSL